MLTQFATAVFIFITSSLRASFAPFCSYHSNDVNCVRRRRKSKISDHCVELLELPGFTVVELLLEIGNETHQLLEPDVTTFSTGNVKL